MPSMKELIVYQKFYDLILYSFPIIDRFPQKQKFVLGQQIQNCMLEVIKLIIQANKFGDNNRLAKLYNIDVELEKLRLLIRLSVDLGFMSYEKYGNHCEKITEIGKLLGGWIKVSKGA
jgi:four helix bundle protein